MAAIRNRPKNDTQKHNAEEGNPFGSPEMHFLSSAEAIYVCQCNSRTEHL